MAPRPQLRAPAEEYLVIGEKKLTVEYPQKFILNTKSDEDAKLNVDTHVYFSRIQIKQKLTKDPKQVLYPLRRCHLQMTLNSNRKTWSKSIQYLKGKTSLIEKHLLNSFYNYRSHFRVWQVNLKRQKSTTFLVNLRLLKSLVKVLIYPITKEKETIQFSKIIHNYIYLLSKDTIPGGSASINQNLQRGNSFLILIHLSLTQTSPSDMH